MTYEATVDYGTTSTSENSSMRVTYKGHTLKYIPRYVVV